jgi:viroplasmin and RNaseH domain-containing protein
MEIMEINGFKGDGYKTYNRLEEAKQAFFNGIGSSPVEF